MNNKKLGAIISGVVIAGLVIGGFMSMHKIKAGYVGLVYSLNGGIKDNVLTQGMHFVAPWEKVKQYSVSIEQGYLSKDNREGSEGDDSFDVPTSDGKTVNVDLEYSYHFDSELLPTTYVKFKGQDGKAIEDTFIRGKLKTWAGEVTSKYSVIDIYGDKRTELNKAVSDYMTPLFKEYGIVLDACNFSRIELDSQTANAIQERINKQQELETSKLQAEKIKIETEANAEKIKIESEAEVVQAENKAKANEILSKSIDENIIKQQTIDKWNGELPKVNGNSSMMINSDILK